MIHVRSDGKTNLISMKNIVVLLYMSGLNMMAPILNKEQ